MWKNKYQELKKYAKEQGLKVLLKGKETLHDYAAMNPLAGFDMHWPIKVDEIWICKDGSWKYKFECLRHELEEMQLMSENGMKYGPAHVKALKDEKNREVALWKN